MPISHFASSDPATLVAALAEQWNGSSDDPLAIDVVITPARGTRRWLAQQLALNWGQERGGDGICAGVEFWSPEQLIDRVLGRAESSPWRGDGLVQALLVAMTAAADEPWFAGIKRHLKSQDSRPHRRIGFARRVARLFERYALWQPGLPQSWLEAFSPLDNGENAAWQAGLWRELTRVQGPNPLLGLGEQLQSAGTDPLPAYARLAYFCPDHWPAVTSAVIRALANHHQVGLFSRRSEADPATAAGSIATALGRERQAANRALAELAPAVVLEPLPRPAGTSLLAQVQTALLDGLPPELSPTPERPGSSPGTPEVTSLNASQTTITVGGSSPGTPEGTSPAAEPGRYHQYLAAWQGGTFDPSSPAAEPGRRYHQPTGSPAEPVIPENDTSLVFHAAATPERQVDILRHCLLELFEADPSLEPRQILVICPAIAAYRGLLEAAFGVGDDQINWRHPAHRLRLRLSGAWLPNPNPVLDLLNQVIELGLGRAALSQLLRLLSNPALTAAFSLADDEVDQLEQLLESAGIRWGITAKRRAPYGLDLPENTWQTGLARLVVGLARPTSDLIPVGTALAAEGIGADQAHLVGTMLELSGRLRRLLDQWATPAPLPVWAERMRTAVNLLTRPYTGYENERAEVGSLLAAWSELSDQGAELTLAEAGSLLAAWGSGRRGRDRFLTGDLTVAAPEDLRHIPHRVIIWLGLDAASFPRRPPADGDDLLGTPPYGRSTLTTPHRSKALQALACSSREGTLDPAGQENLSSGGVPGRSDNLLSTQDPAAQPPNPTWLDRLRLFDSLLDAHEKFIAIYHGRDARTNAERMAPDPLRDLTTVVSLVAGPAAADRLTQYHPVHPFSASNGQATTYDPALAAASQRLAARLATGPIPAGPAPPPEPDQSVPPPPLVIIDNIAASLANPAAHYLRSRAGVSSRLLGNAEKPADEIPLDLDALARWQISQRFLELALAGQSKETILAAEQLRGTLPPRRLAQPVLEQAWSKAQQVINRAAHQLAQPERWLGIDLSLPGLPRLVGQVGLRGNCLLSLSAGRPGVKAQLTAWLTLLALQLTEPATKWQAQLIGPSLALTLAAELPQAQAETLLTLYLQLALAAGASPLPLPAETGLQLAAYLSRGATPEESVIKERWEAEWSKDVTWQLVLPHPADLWTQPLPDLDLAPAVTPKPGPLSSLPKPRQGLTSAARSTSGKAVSGCQQLAEAVYVPLLRAGGAVPPLWRGER